MGKIQEKYTKKPQKIENLYFSSKQNLGTFYSEQNELVACNSFRLRAKLKISIFPDFHI